MICIKERYFKYHRIALTIAGLWPYQQSKVVQFQLVLFLGISTSFIIFQVLKYSKSSCDTLQHTRFQRKQYFNTLNTFDIFLLQFSKLLFVEYSFDFTIQMLSIVTFCIFFLINYLSFWVNMETVSWCSALCESILDNNKLYFPI